MATNSMTSALNHVASILGSSHYSDTEVCILIPDIRLVNEFAKQKYLEGFRSICDFSLANEPATRKFCAFTSRKQECDSIWMLEHFDDEAALAEHRKAHPVVNMLSWMMETSPTGNYPLPIPLPLQTTNMEFVRPEFHQAQDPFIVLTQSECATDSDSKFERSIEEFGMKAKDQSDVLMFMPGKTETGTWVVLAAYTTELSFGKYGLSKKMVGEAQIASWQETFLKLEAGFVSRIHETSDLPEGQQQIVR